MITDVAVAQPRTLPNIILDKVPGVDLDQNLVDAGVGVIDISSVYDIDGVDTANPNIATVADPAKTAAERAPGALPAPGEGGVDPGQDRRRPLGRRLRRQQLHARDPRLRADRAGRLGARGGAGQRRLPHGACWMPTGGASCPRRASGCRCKPGRGRSTCNGCHRPASAQKPISHGRAGTCSTSAWAGAAASGAPFPHTIASGTGAFMPEPGRNHGAGAHARQLRERHTAVPADGAGRERGLHATCGPTRRRRPRARRSTCATTTPRSS